MTSYWSSTCTWKRDISTNLYQNWLSLGSKTYLSVLYNMAWSIMLPWQQTGLQTSPMLEAFLASFGIPLWYFSVMLYLPDPAGAGGTLLQFMFYPWVLLSFFFIFSFVCVLSVNQSPNSTQPMLAAFQITPQTKRSFRLRALCHETLAVQRCNPVVR